ncbi:MAG: hypothetical protein F6K30_13850 [Cyanothece sp. SIO2G6]|nr:hypothetical protein [Cyanothece sp. SIO2G6]
MRLFELGDRIYFLTQSAIAPTPPTQNAIAPSLFALLTIAPTQDDASLCS